MADDHAANEPAAVETWLCTFNEGKGMADMDKWFDGVNEYAKTQTNNQYNMYQQQKLKDIKILLLKDGHYLNLELNHQIIIKI